MIQTPVAIATGDLSCSVPHRRETFWLWDPDCRRKFVPPTLSSWLLLTSCSRRTVSSFFIKVLSSPTVVLLCTKLLISCCCPVTFCGRQRDRRKDGEGHKQRQRKRATGYITHLKLTTGLCPVHSLKNRTTNFYPALKSDQWKSLIIFHPWENSNQPLDHFH